jgi:hypothetical protein
MELFYKLFEYSTDFNNFVIFETENIVASMQNSEYIEDILTINKWKEKQKEVTNEIIKIFESNLWSDNCYRYKL